MIHLELDIDGYFPASITALSQTDEVKIYYGRAQCKTSLWQHQIFLSYYNDNKIVVTTKEFGVVQVHDKFKLTITTKGL